MTRSSPFRTLQAALTGELIVPTDTKFDASRQIWNLDIDLRPAAIVCCATEQDVVRALEFARTHDFDVAVRSGGHGQAGHALSDGGVVIDLGGLHQVSVDPRQRIARVAAGTRVGAMLDAIGAAGMVTPVGTCPDVGIGGLALGGGESIIMARYGATCDNVLSARVVTAAGQLLTASADEHAELYWAIRGGGGNFGVVTTFEFRLHRLERMLSGRFVFPMSRTEDVMRRYRELLSHAPDELQTSGGLDASGDEPVLYIAVCHCGRTAAAHALVERWRDLLRPTSDDIAWGPYLADSSVPPIASESAGAFLYDLDDEVIQLFVDYFHAAPRWCTAVWTDYHGFVTRVAADAVAFPLRHAGYDVYARAGWKSTAERRKALAWLTDLHTALGPRSHGVYVNNIGREPAQPARDAYGGNYERLTRAKALYDPGNLFHVNHNILPRNERHEPRGS